MFDWNRYNPRSRSVASNVQQYMAGATFPPLHFCPSAPAMPPEGHKSQKNKLTVRLERYRKLGQMNRFKAVRLATETRRCELLHFDFDPSLKLTPCKSSRSMFRASLTMKKRSIRKQANAFTYLVRDTISPQYVLPPSAVSKSKLSSRLLQLSH